MGLLRNCLEGRIADLFGYSDAILFGRARSGVLALLDVLGLSRDAGFIMPSNICPSLLMAVHSYGSKIGLADVSELNGLPSDNTFVEAMQQAERPGVVMPTHLYGFVQPYPKTVANARARVSYTHLISELESVLADVMRETRSIQINAQRSRDELRATQQRVTEKEARIHELEGELEKTSTLIRYDQLTGALNRRGLEEMFTK